MFKKLIIATSIALQMAVSIAASISKEETETIFYRYGCRKYSVSINGGAGEGCLNDLVFVMVVTPQFIMLESYSEVDAAAVLTILQKLEQGEIKTSGKLITISLH